MIRHFLLSVFLLGSVAGFAQESTSSPYSYYGIGEIRFRGTAEIRSMGGLSILPDSIHMNLQNPAFYPQLRLTTFTVGGSYMTTRLKNNFEEESARRSALDYLAVAFPVGSKGGFGFGLMPYSATGYKVRTIQNIDGIDFRRTYYGKGGLNRVFAGGGYKIGRDFTIGAEIQYYFGNIESRSDLTNVDLMTGLQFGTRETNESSAGGFGFSTGISYNRKITEKLSLAAAASYVPSTEIRYSNERQLMTIQEFTGGTLIADLDTLTIGDSRIKMPSRFSFGASIGEMKKWMVGAEAEFRSTSDLGNRFDVNADVGFENSQRFSVGGYYIPQYNSVTSYLKRINYRGGLRYETTGLVLNGKTIQDFSGTFGLGIPLSGTFSNLNLGVEYGKRGTRDAGLVEENYVNFFIGLSFNDRWFVKRKYD